MINIGIAERKEREKTEMREEILKAARTLMAVGGAESISVRKIADIIEYSPAMIYHYFKNKEEIIEKLIEQDYAQILGALSALKDTRLESRDELKQSAAKYIELAVEMGDFYKEMMTNDSPAILARTSVLQKGAAAERPAVAMLCGAIRSMPAFADSGDGQTELTAQIFWAACFGLAMRMITEKTDPAQRSRLIERMTEMQLQLLDPCEKPAEAAIKNGGDH